MNVNNEDELTHKICKILVNVLDKEDVHIGAAAMICLLVRRAQDNGVKKSYWINQMSLAWNFYKDNDKRP